MLIPVAINAAIPSSNTEAPVSKKAKAFSDHNGTIGVWDGTADVAFDLVKNLYPPTRTQGLLCSARRNRRAAACSLLPVSLSDFIVHCLIL